MLVVCKLNMPKSSMKVLASFKFCLVVENTISQNSYRIFIVIGKMF